MGLAIEGPSEAQMSCKDNCDGTCTVDYIPTEAGDYDVAIKFDDKNIPGKYLITNKKKLLNHCCLFKIYVFN